MKIIVSAHTIEILGASDISTGEYNATKCYFTFSEEYTNNLRKVAVFTDNGKVYKNEIINNECYIPPEILSTDGSKLIGVYAEEILGNKIIIRFSPRPKTIDVSKGSYTPVAENGSEITPTEYEQYINLLHTSIIELKKEINDYASDANEQVEEAIETFEQESEEAIETFEQESTASIQTFNQASSSALQGFNQSSTSAIQNFNQTSASAIQTFNQASSSALQSFTQTASADIQSFNQSSSSAIQNFNQASSSAIDTFEVEADGAITTLNQRATSVLNESTKRVNAVIENLNQKVAAGDFDGPQGEKGEKGDPGYSPVKGVDYFTESEKTSMVNEVESGLQNIPDEYINNLN